LDGKKIRGTWEIPDNCEGEFEIKVPIKRWVGSKTQKDEEDMALEFYLKIKNGSVFGFGEDDNGRFYVNGYQDPAQSCISFIKSYVGSYQVHYNGSLVSKNHMIGTWVMAGNEATDHGSFDINLCKSVE